jgi:hypothetical protein
LLLPASGADLATASRLAQFALTEGRNHPLVPYLELCQGLADFRQANDAMAQHWLQQALSHGWADANLLSTGNLLLAMSDYRLDQTEAANSIMSHLPPVKRGDWPGSSAEDLGVDWIDYLFVNILFREANALIQPGTKAVSGAE